VDAWSTSCGPDEPSSWDEQGEPELCPLCGATLDPLVLAVPDPDYFCPICCTQKKPAEKRRPLPDTAEETTTRGV
jgi:hypothetical protein